MFLGSFRRCVWIGILTLYPWVSHTVKEDGEEYEYLMSNGYIMDQQMGPI